jgi:hypothetical protein
MKHKDIYFLLFTTLILAVLWVVFSIYHNLVSSTISEPLSVDITAIQPNFDKQTIAKLKQRQKVSPLFNAPTQGVPSPEPESTGSGKIASPSP